MYHSDKYHGRDWISGSSLIRYVKTFGICFICEKILDGMEYQHPNSMLKTVPFNPLDGIFRGGSIHRTGPFYIVSSRYVFQLRHAIQWAFTRWITHKGHMFLLMRLIAIHRQYRYVYSSIQKPGNDFAWKHYFPTNRKQQSITDIID